ncbi:hypothetical protein EIN_405070 [Entamoeba invadens IP1]|uniref:EGF-like domain-containing protein n=1 Tax=Entamoeba invadens IP1 TaxID=370355 RepID=A0A0A1U6P8_ENTIV|nr:hypothetical protein EIN_405070 [Entamoeba invadens IP1]ELP90093.1 hypothetical protein EIN_405070 [Entamoeba invadens IP1]|eukprot:XP_004256864.1 hypothetical protein EIN_405070 [Entamoeba invadens IP1]
MTIRLLVDIVTLAVITAASICDGKEENGYYCDGNILTNCADGDVLTATLCTLGCNETTRTKTSCTGSSSCFYGYPGSFCEIKKVGEDFQSGVTVCHRNGIQQYFSCLTDCVQLTESFARCTPSDKCVWLDRSSKTFGYCPTPKTQIHESDRYNFALNDALARELQQELALKSPFCPFMSYLAACSLVYTECTTNAFFSKEDGTSCFTDCNNYNDCAELSGISSKLDCSMLCATDIVTLHLFLLFILLL